jgi:competence protein ComEC
MSAASFLLGALLALSVPAQAGTLRVDMLDIGQGDSILLTSPAGKRILIDAGPAPTEAAEYLRRIGVTSLDLAIATHPHADHIGGMQAVLEQIPTRIYLDSGQVHTTATYTDLMGVVEDQVDAGTMSYQPALNGQVFNLDDGITVKVLWPGERKLSGTRSDLNSNSVVVRVTPRSPPSMSWSGAS